MIKVIETARNLSRELEEMKASRDVWRIAFWIAAVALGVALARLMK